ncbi:HEAT repeat protein [Talaromyces stipitatus ATCC 10500]|uniref:HEAT repeat protein n=1 Tax=Talaromyces stipitatus (strain ATCC 10500 / CBS 375.48 / QM 6759 / NRRL 1006) TaxID=441959 RepID=B8M7S3_TALSN|nr:HEAT repeat protein [Talaromyces stipitatus ATCC 10500]EED19802.1 HEAT repeat protein [Talaromyces stipitatus ATCC 10500]
MILPEAGLAGGDIPDVDADIKSFPTSIQLVPEEVLSRICKGPLRAFLQDCRDEQQVKCVWDSLFLTFSTRSVSKGQTQAACNAVIHFLETASSSSIPSTKDLAYSDQIWLAVFEVVLTRFDDTTPKPMKQVLSGLFKFLKRHPDTVETRRIQVGLIDKMMPSIILADPRSRLKSSLVALERLLRESGIPVSAFMSLIHDWLIGHYGDWQPLYAQHCQALSVDISPFNGTGMRYDDVRIGVKHSVSTIFSLAILIHAKEQGFMLVGGSLMAYLYKKAGQEIKDCGQSCYPMMSWIRPSKRIMLENMDCLELFSRSILLPLLETDIKGFRAFIGELPLDPVLSGNMEGDWTVDEFILLFSALGVGKKIGFVHEDQFEKRTAATRNADVVEVLILKSDILGRFLLYNEPRVRLLALSLLTTAPVLSKPISAIALKSIAEGLFFMHADSDSYIRQETMSLMRKLMLRLRGPGVQKDFMEKEGKDSKLFMERYVDFLENELLPTASYQRHISALKSISLVLKTGVDPNAPNVPHEDQMLWRYKVNVLRPSLFRLLVDLLLDPFEEVRATALYLIGLFPSHLSTEADNNGFNVAERLVTALLRAEALASKTSRADHADTVARLYHSLYSTAKDGNNPEAADSWFSTKAGVVNEILRRLEAKLSQETGPFQPSVRDGPLHGYTSAIRYIVATPNFYTTISDSSDRHISSWRTVHNRIVAICENIWTKVKPVLCVDSPEGHTVELIDDFMVGPKDLLSYSWRALKDSSNLLHAVVANVTYAPQNEHDGLRCADFEAIGTLSFVQLSELRHRGAFSTVAQTFAACCLRCAENENPEISGLPDLWYEDSLKMIQHQASKLTRRSAGLPALVTGICISKSGDPLFGKIMSDLQEISRVPAVQTSSYNELSLPQVHAMNCLKDILANAKLASSAESYIMDVLRLAADSLSCPIWAIRNCGLMLFHASMNRMCARRPGVPFGFGGASGVESNMTLAFPKYEGLTQLLAQLLASADEARSDGKEFAKGVLASNETEKVFPALEIITEKVPSTTNDDDDLLRGLVLRHVKSTIWAVREQAARVYASLLRFNDMLSSINQLIDGDLAKLSQIHLHGQMLCARYTFLRVWHSKYWRGNVDDVLATVQKVFAGFYPYIRSPFGQATLFDVLVDVIESNIGFGKEVTSKTTRFVSEIIDNYSLEHGLAELLNSGPQPPSRISAMRAESLLRRSLSWCLILNNKLSMVAFPEELSPTGLMGPFFDLSSSDSDGACWILERIPIVFPGYEGQKEFLSLYLLVLLQSFHEEDVKAKVALNLAGILEDALERGIQVEFPSKWARVSDHLSIQEEENIWSRELTENVLRLQGSLLTLKYMDEENLSSTTETNGGLDSLAVRRWAVNLRSALSEETVFSARLSAIMSLKTFSRILRKPNQAADATPTSLEIYLILYDMLNDDDDELRSLSAPIASWVVSHSKIFPNQRVMLGAMPASESLVEFIASNYAKQPALFHHVVTRLMRETFPKKKRNEFKSFETLFEDYSKESIALFEEEKQNLFIDDVREIDIWTKAFRHLDKSACDQTTIKKLAIWVSDGLKYLNAKVLSLSTSDDQGDNVLGWTSKPEVYTLGCLLFSVASLLIPISGESDTTLLRETLENIHERGRMIFLHPQWLDRIQAAISTGEMH